jgi:hypothetical protein
MKRLCEKALTLGKAMPLLLALSLPGIAFSQVDSVLLERVSRISVGASLGMQGLNPALGIDITSPAFLKRSLSVRIHGSTNWHEWYKAQTDNWVTYPELGVALVFTTRPSQRARAFVEAGPFFLFPSRRFSDKNFESGFRGLVGAEMFNRHGAHLTLSYFFGAGLAICYADAEKLNNRPAYGDGFFFKTGLRFYF